MIPELFQQLDRVEQDFFCLVILIILVFTFQVLLLNIQILKVSLFKNLQSLVMYKNLEKMTDIIIKFY